MGDTMANENTEEKTEETTPDSTVSIHKTTNKTELTNWHRPFWRTVVSSEFGNGSTARIASLTIIAVSLGLVRDRKSTRLNIPPNLMELGWFSSMLVTVVYSPSKIAGIFKSFSSNMGKK